MHDGHAADIFIGPVHFYQQFNVSARVFASKGHGRPAVALDQRCGGQVISDSLIGFVDVDSRSKVLGDKLHSFECSLMLL